MTNDNWNIFVTKIDKEGSNCPTIEEILYEVSNIIYSELNYNNDTQNDNIDDMSI